MNQSKQTYFPVFLTLGLLLFNMLTSYLLSGRFFPNLSLWVPIGLNILVGIGYIVSLVLGLRSTNQYVKWFSVLANIAFLLSLSVITFLLLLANGISEP
ncbi:hypothetical protein [Exiguobacterium antarcticum]|uniref:Uncharacterized protein n=1 Tax=Exiguobacterium antarcticum TaxID=132920 RepID=A0ABT6R7X5_9BACL|nr:hypothetical protein [Exiguobacterium antarcticum]AFS69439.1 hypothetical protein Eab7_0277 [Exiguobacterium antarcticum B7]MDI3236381.1 hypothetical protein [Exiguobacterium antarcticum]